LITWGFQPGVDKVRQFVRDVPLGKHGPIVAQVVETGALFAGGKGSLPSPEAIRHAKMLNGARKDRDGLPLGAQPVFTRTNDVRVGRRTVSRRYRGASPRQA
jgi:hypothetical protein